MTGLEQWLRTVSIGQENPIRVLFVHVTVHQFIGTKGVLHILRGRLHRRVGGFCQIVTGPSFACSFCSHHVELSTVVRLASAITVYRPKDAMLSFFYIKIVTVILCD